MNRHSLSRLAGTIMAVLLFVLGAATVAAAAPPAQAVVNAAQPDLPEEARGLPMGGVLRLEDIVIEGETANTLELSRFRVFSTDAEIVVDNNYSFSPPDNAYFRGNVEDVPESVAVLVVPESGDPEGLIVGPKGIWKIEKKNVPAVAALAARKVKDSELAPLKEFRCGFDHLSHTPTPELLPEDAVDSPESAPITAAAIVSYTARVAVETDYELYARFNDVDAAATYVGNLFAYISGIYEAETATSLNISFLRLWTGGSGADPWTVTSSPSNALYEFRTYWNTNEAGRERTIAHMLSGKGLGGGVAWLGVLCNQSYGYGLSASLTRTTLDTTKTVWDTMVVAHEIGHNFDSPHTHDYCNIGDNNQPVDACAPNQYGGACNGQSSQYPAGCVGSDQGCGTIMSYCHLLGGGYGNIAMTFGLDHPYGVAAFRVPQKMGDHVEIQAQSYPTCLEPLVDGPSLTISKDGAGSGTVTSTPGGIDCGLDCSSPYAPHTSVQLSAFPDPGSDLSGWGGDCTGTEDTTSVNMDSDKSCTATFVSLCGNGVKESGEQCDGEDLGGASCPGCGKGTGDVPTCTDSCTLDFSACYDGTCNGGEENCATCPQECPGGTAGGAICGNGLCEAADGENCLSCPLDCAGVTGGKPSGRYCCGFNDGLSPNGCSDGTERCTTGGFFCTETSAPNVSYCCGDLQCGGEEDPNSCEIDCAGQPYCGDAFCQSSENGLSCPADCKEIQCTDDNDNDGDGLTDCADNDCSGDPACASSCSAAGVACSANAECCSNNCHRKKKICL